MHFIFGNSENKNFNDFCNETKKHLLNEENEWISNKSELEEFHPKDFEEYFRFIYHYYGEDFIKYHLATDFDIQFFDDLDENNEVFTDSQIIRDHYLAYQKYNFFIYQDENQCIAVVDILNEKLFNWLAQNIQSEEIEIQFAKKQDVIKKIQKICEIELMRFSVNPNENNKYSPSAIDINYSSKSFILKTCFFATLFILLSFKFVFFSVFAITIFNISYLTSTLYKLFLSFTNDVKENDLKKETIGSQNHLTGQQPIYTIMLPLLNEEKSTITQLISAIRNINYPQHQLDVKLLLEEDDELTQTVVSLIKLDYNFDLIIIPNGTKYGHPKTKARACNYGFNFSKGEYLVIYDGDDIPNPEQLNFSLNKFFENQELSCIQYPLNSYNREENLLTNFYSIEFDIWYKVFLPAIKKLGMPVTFGGTSSPIIRGQPQTGTIGARITF
jgi:cellulose synthase/poly-beta-1,6-N-acetylglucosamine synthase-like glycosyltransferase